MDNPRAAFASATSASRSAFCSASRASNHEAKTSLTRSAVCIPLASRPTRGTPAEPRADRTPIPARRVLRLNLDGSSLDAGEAPSVTSEEASPDAGEGDAETERSAPASCFGAVLDAMAWAMRSGNASSRSAIERRPDLMASPSSFLGSPWTVSPFSLIHALDTRSLSEY